MNAIVALCHFCDLHGPQVLMSTQFSRIDESGTSAPVSPEVTSPGKPELKRSLSNESSLNKTKEKCEACQFIPTEFSGFVSSDEEAGLCFSSRPYPTDGMVFALVKDACIRSFSSEVSQTREGPLFFGADRGLQVLTYKFFASDAQSRGQLSSYCILVAMRDAFYLLNSWPFLTGALQRLVEDVQKKARAVCAAEQGAESLHFKSSTFSPSDISRSRGTTKTTRSLRALTGDSLLPQRLHAWFTWILRAGAARLTERLMEGPPSEDAVIDWERQEETEEGYIHVRLRHLSSCDLSDLTSKPAVNAASTDVASADATSSGDDSFTPCAFRDIRDIVLALGMNFHLLAYHTIVGDQVIVKCDEKRITRSFIDALKVLLPAGCVRVMYYSPRYEDTYRCNLLGLPTDVHIPSHAATSDFSVVIEIIPSREWIATHTAESNSSPVSTKHHTALHSEQQMDEPDFTDWEFNVTCGSTIPDKFPTVLGQMLKAIHDTNISPLVLQDCLTCLKESWVSKVKIFFKLTKDWGVSDGAGSDNIRRLLTALDAQPHDWLLLKFWVQGLSAQLRLYLLSSTPNRN